MDFIICRLLSLLRLQAGLYSTSHGGNYFTGAGASFPKLAGDNPPAEIGKTAEKGSNVIPLEDGVEYTNEYARGFSDKNFEKNPKGLRHLHADGTLPPSTKRVTYSKSGNRAYYDGTEMYGVAIYQGSGSRMSDVYLYKIAFTSKMQLYLTMGHEYLHVAYAYKFGGSGSEYDEHHEIYQWEYKQAKAWGFMTDHIKSQYYNYYEKYPYYEGALKYSPFKFGYKILQNVPW